MSTYGSAFGSHGPSHGLSTRTRFGSDVVVVPSYCLDLGRALHFCLLTPPRPMLRFVPVPLIRRRSSPPPFIRHHLPLLLSPLRHLDTLAPPALPLPRHPSAKDAYFAVVHHIAGIVRRDFYLERTLGRLRLPPPTPDLVLRVLRAAAPSAPLPALRFFAWARRSSASYRPSAAEFDALILPLARHRHWSQMWSVAADMRSLSLPLLPSTFASVIDAYGQAALADLAVDVFNRLPKFDCPQTTAIYNALLSALCRVGNFHGAYALIRRMARKQVPPDRQTFSTLVDAWCAAGYLEAAKEMVRRMTKEGVLPDVTTFNSLLEAVCKSGETDFCVGLLQDASELGLCPDISTYKILIPAVSKLGKIEEAFRLFYCAVEDGNKPFPSLYAAIIKALCRAGRFSDAFGLFKDMKVKGHPPNRPVYTMLVKMCVRGGRFVEAANYLVEMTEMGLVPMPQSFDSVVDGLKHRGKHELAKRMEQLEVSIRGY
ncbi:PPR repeat [Musa troglodytarum]|uniref:PPR repeat n=1 Tax=Musa troglodytarum TaxID=320322 RepID=A0A9E7EXA0_9LILI|nr:PPR repeat [Musa troglodytarum]